jgi:hypothetical protein
MRYTIFASVIAIIFTIFVLVFAISADRREVRLLPKAVWVLICLIPAVGGLLYLTVGRPIADAATNPNAAPGSAGNRKTMAPDDDPKFLRDLAERIKRQQRDADKDPDAKTE